MTYRTNRANRCKTESSWLFKQPMQSQRLVGDADLNARIKQLRDLVVTLDRIDSKLETVNADVYRAAASAAFSLTYEEMGLLPMSDFAGPTNALQNMAENIHFAVNGRFADLDGTGQAQQALLVGEQLLARMRIDGLGQAHEITDSLFARLGSHAR